MVTTYASTENYEHVLREKASLEVPPSFVVLAQKRDGVIWTGNREVKLEAVNTAKTVETQLKYRNVHVYQLNESGTYDLLTANVTVDFAVKRPNRKPTQSVETFDRDTIREYRLTIDEFSNTLHVFAKSKDYGNESRANLIADFKDMILAIGGTTDEIVEAME